MSNKKNMQNLKVPEKGYREESLTKHLHRRGVIA